jgi:molybdate transport system ATP-binding protein
MSFDVDVRRRVGDVEIACRIAPGAGVSVLFGPSGAGKTSVLNMVAGLARPDCGHVRVGERTLFDAAAGIDVPPEARRAGYVFQDARLFPHLRVRANLLYGWRRGVDIDVEATIALLGIAPLLDRWPRTLSGGEAKRVAIGRALLADPAFLLLDEPLASLDRPRREEIMRLLERLRDEAALPILLVTHDRDEAERLGDRIIAI